MPPLDPRQVCYFQGRNALGESLPDRAPFRPFYAFSFALPGISAEHYCEVRSWCNYVLGESDEGRWLEDFDFWHLGDPEAAEAFRRQFIDTRRPTWSSPVITSSDA